MAPRVIQVRARQLVRVVDIRDPDDGLNHEPTIRADFAEVRVSISGAATQIAVLPSFDEMQRVCNRSADDLAFWRAIIASPDDDLPRMVYADWLDEHGDPAGYVLRGDKALVLNCAVAVGDRWEHRNARSATWRLAATEFQNFISSGGRFYSRPGCSQIDLCRFARRRPNSADGQWHWLNISTPSGVPSPTFLSYLFVQMALSLMLKQVQQPRPAQP
jgi:uncharacterized protein (TIGR02996 family)